MFFFQSKDPYIGRKPASWLVHVALDRWSKRMLRADNTSVIVAYFDPPGLHSDSLLRQPSDVSTASTLKASDGEDESGSSSTSSSSDSELDEIFPMDGMDIISEDSHQASMTPPLTPRALMDSYSSGSSKPSLKRLPASSSNRSLSPHSILARKPRSLPHSMVRHLKSSHSSPLALGSKCAKHHNTIFKDVKQYKAHPVRGTENDPNKVAACMSPGTSKKRATPANNDTSLPKRPRLASPESSHIADSPLVLDGSRQQRHVAQQTPTSCSPLNIDLAAAVTSDLAMVSPLWPSHLADDLDLSEPVTAIKTKLGKGNSSDTLMRDVLQENLVLAIPSLCASSCESPTSDNDTPASSSKCTAASQGSQNRSPATRATVRRLAKSSPRRTRISPYSAKLQVAHRSRTVRRAAPKRSS